jgi:eukaryotic-like serine/threonine-protein kinase
MGVVYLALDTKLERHVAIKVLRPEALEDPDRRRRFVQEAKAVSALNHPNIVTIHDIATSDGMDYIVMEYVAGRTLSAWIAEESAAESKAHGTTGAPPVRQVLHYGLQIADALSKAHAAGIIHRDIKPDNVIVTDEDRVKVLDFGLAKLLHRKEPNAAAATAGAGNTVRSPALASTEIPSNASQANGAFFDPEADGTLLGAVMGTAEYMSPEQAEGQTADARSDIFSFGVLLYEMLTGRRAFDGPTKSEAMQRIVKFDPLAPSAVVPSVPAGLEKIVLRCLQKDPRRRFQQMEEVRRELSAQGAELSPASAWSLGKKSFVAATAVVLLAGLGVGIGQFRDSWRRSHRPLMKIIPVTTFPGQLTDPAISPDGQRVAFLWDGGENRPMNLYVKPVEGGDPVRLTNSDRRESRPAWSPDGTQIAFLRNRAGEPGSDVLLIAAPDQHAPSTAALAVRAIGTSTETLDWSPQGNLLVTSQNIVDKGLWTIDVATGAKRRLTVPANEDLDRGAKFSPDGRTVGFVRLQRGGGSYLCTVPASGGAVHQGFFERRGISGLAWTSDGAEFVFSWVSLAAQPSMYRVAVEGGVPEQMLAQAYTPSIARHSERLAYQATIHNQNIWRIERPAQLKTGEIAPRARTLISSSQVNTDMQYSPDNTKVVFESSRTGDAEIWIADSDGRHELRLTSFNGPGVGSPSVSPDGRTVAFDAESNIYVIPSGGGTFKKLTSNGINVMPAWSRDSRWIFFTSNRGGTMEVWKVAVDGGEPQQITHQGGAEVKASLDGERLIYSKSNGPETVLWSVPVSGGAETPLGISDPILRRQWDVSRDGVFFVRKRDMSVALWDFKARRAIPIMTLEKPLSMATRNFAVSPDGRWLAWGQVDINSKDINVVDPFR